TIEAAAVVSNLGRAGTLALAPPEAIPFGEDVHRELAPIGCAKVLFGLNGLLPVAGLGAAALRGRLIVAERPETLGEAKGAALGGRIPERLVLEVTVPSAADPASAPVGQSTVSVLVPYLPVHIEGGWDAQHTALLRQVIATLEAYAPGLGERL